MKKKVKTKRSIKSARVRKSNNRRSSEKAEPGLKAEIFGVDSGNIGPKCPSLLENIDTSYFQLDLNGNFTYFNDVVCKDLGYSREELHGMNFRAFSKLENIKIIKNIYGEIYKTGKTKTTVNFEVLRKDGSAITIEQSISVLKDSLGKVVGFQGVARDISQRIRSERLRMESEEKYRMIMETIVDGYFEFDLRGNFTFFNNAGCLNLGYRPDELLGMNYRDITATETAQRLYEEFNQIYLTGATGALIDYEVILKDGSIKHHEMSVGLKKDLTGQPIGFHLLARDITARKEAEAALRRSEEMYRTILDTMEEGLYENDLRGNYTFVNRTACKQLERPPEELLGKNYRDITSPKMATKLYEVFHRIYVTGKPELLFTYDVPCSTGEIRTYQMNATLIRNASGEITGFRNLNREITELKKVEEERERLEQQLLQAKKLESIGRLAGGVAHDFNNMLTVILGYTELIKAMPSLDPMLMRNMQEVEKAAKRSRDLTAQLLAFSRKQIIAPRQMDLNGLILDTQQTLARLVGEDIDLRFYPGKDMWKIKFDPSQMEQILVNLAANARDAMPRGGKLTIETENIHLNEMYCKIHHGFVPGHYVLLEVTDDGAGISKDALPHIFEPFFTTKEAGRGTGLGLATVYGIVKQNNGFINVYSELRRGTTFKIYIPRCTEEGEIAEEPEEIPEVAGSGTIILVEDDEMVRQITTEMLESIGYTTIAMDNPLDVPELFERGDIDIDLLITDVVMPAMSGNDLRDRIEAIRPGVKVLFMSGYTSNVIVHRGVLEEGVHFIQKPFNLSDLARKIREVLSS